MGGALKSLYTVAGRKAGKLHQIALTSQVEPFADGKLNLVKIRLMGTERYPEPQHEVPPVSVHCEKCFALSVFISTPLRSPIEPELTADCQAMLEGSDYGNGDRANKGVIVFSARISLCDHLARFKKDSFPR